MEYMIMHGLRSMLLSSMDADNSPLRFMKWERYIEKVHRSVNKLEITPREWTEKGFFEWIVDRSDIQIQLSDWLDFCKEENMQSRKDKNKAKRLRDQGNNFFKKKDYSASVKRYTESARYAPNNDDYFSTAIANRSAAFFHMCKYKNCLQDIQLAIETGYPKALQWKLHLRAAQSHLELRQGKLAEDSLAELQKIVESDSKMPGAMKANILKQVEDLLVSASETRKKFKDFKPKPTKKTDPKDMLLENPMFPFASPAIACKSSPAKGKYVVATESIKRGDVIFAEKPFAWIPLKHELDVRFCAHCCKPVDDSLLPCRGCVEALYCNLDCWNEAWSYHQWECPGYHLGIWPQIGVSHLAFKILIMSITTTDEVRFNAVQALDTKIEKRSADDILSLVLAALMLTSYIEKYTNILDAVDLKKCLVDKFADPGMSFDIDISTKKGKKKYLGSMLLRHSLQMCYYSFGLEQLINASFEDPTSVDIATGAYPSSALMNHSCDPSVMNSSWNDWLIVTAVKDIRAGDEIFHCYGPSYQRVEKDERQVLLGRQYCIDCQCSACRNPRCDNFPARFDGMRCPKCSGSALPLTGVNSQRCIDCDSTSRIIGTQALQIAAKYYARGNEFFDIRAGKEATSSFEKCLEIRERYLYKHHNDLVATLDSLVAVYSINGDWSKCLSCVDRSIAAMEERYGDYSMELGIKLNQITAALFGNLKLIPKSSDEYRDILIKVRKYVDRALEIISLGIGPWTDTYQEVNRKREQLSGMLLEQLRAK